MPEAAGRHLLASFNAEKRVFLGIILVFVLISGTYNVVIPAGEGVDEIPHLQFTLFIKANRALPILPPFAQPDTILMGHHPPLYYVVAALLLAPLDTSDLSDALVVNPHFVWIEGYGPGNRNVFLHSPVTGGDPFPYRGVVLAIHALRIASTAQGVAALVVARLLVRRLLGRRPWLVLAAVTATAFQPTFLSTFSLAHHDATVALLTLTGIWWAVEYGAPVAPKKTRWAALIGATILGLDLLVKTNAIVLVPVYLTSLALRWRHTRQSQRILEAAIQIALVVALVAGWWYARNEILYGDLLGQNAFAATHPLLIRQGDYGIGDVVAFFQQLRQTIWGSFGYMNLLVDRHVGDALWITVGIALPGALVALRGRRGQELFVGAWLISATAIVALLAVFLRYSILVAGVGHGRFFVAVIPIVISLVVVGLDALSPKRFPIFPVAFASAMMGYGVLVPFLVIEPAYRPPVVTTMPQISGPSVTFGDQLGLVGAAFESSIVPPAGQTDLTLYWRRVKPIQADLRYRLRLVARDGVTIFDHEYWPAGGGVPTTTWPAEVTYRDTLSIPVPQNTKSGIAVARLSVRGENGSWLETTEHQVEVDVGRVAVAHIPTVEALPADATTLDSVFDSRLELVGARLDRTIDARGDFTAIAYWRGLQSLDEDLTVSVQVLSPDGRLVAQDDAEPASGQAPTSTWVSGQIVVDQHRIQLPSTLSPGQYRVLAVVYRRPSLARLTVSDGHLPMDNVVLGELRVVAPGQPKS